jgi:hypothetical protein
MSEVIITTSTLEVHKDYDINISQRKRYDNKPSYAMVGDGRMDKSFSKPKGIDLIEEALNMSAPEKFCFRAIKDSIKWDRFDNRLIYQVPIRTSEFTATDKTQFQTGFKLLSAKDLVRRISRGVYMINPTALIPTDFEREFSIWSNAKPQTNTI